MATAAPSESAKALLAKIRQEDQSSSSNTGPSKNAGRPTTGTPSSKPDDDGVPTLLQTPAHPLVVKPRGRRPRLLPAMRVSAFGPPVVAKRPGSASDTDMGGAFPPKIKPQGTMYYPARAIPPATPEELSIYPVSHEMLKFPGPPEASTDPQIDAEPENGWDPEFNLQYQVGWESHRLRVEKDTQTLPPPRPATRTAQNPSLPHGDSRHRSDMEESGGGPIPHRKTKDIQKVLQEPTGWDDAAGPADLGKDFSMFEGTPRDQSILSEKEELRLPPWELSEPNVSPTDLSLLAEWDPEHDLEFQNEARENVETPCDYRFKIPETPADIESLQQALEITRMDFWMKNPSKRYPEDLSQYKSESYKSQQRRLQHAFCRIWHNPDGNPPPELYCLPAWMFGFAPYYWKPSSWGYDKRSNVYNQGLAEMAAEKKEKGLQSLFLHHHDWKAKLEGLVPLSDSDATISDPEIG